MWETMTKLLIYCRFNFEFLIENFIPPLGFITIFPLSLLIMDDILNDDGDYVWSLNNPTEYLMNGQIYINYYPNMLVLTKVFKAFPINYKIATDRKSYIQIGEEKGPTISYGVFQINEYTNLTDSISMKPVLPDMNTENITTFVLDVRIFDEIQRFSSVFKSLKLTAIYYLINNFKSSKCDINFSGFPIHLLRPLPWPGLYAVLLYCLMGSFIVNYRSLFRVNECYVTENVSNILSFISLFLTYNFIGFISHVFSVVVIVFNGAVKTFDCNLFYLFFVFTVSFNTGLFFSSVISSIPLHLKTVLFGFSLIFPAHILFVTCTSSYLAFNNFLHYLTYLSPVYLIMRPLIVIEHMESLKMIIPRNYEDGLYFLTYRLYESFIFNVVFWTICIIYLTFYSFLECHKWFLKTINSPGGLSKNIVYKRGSGTFDSDELLQTVIADAVTPNTGINQNNASEYSVSSSSSNINKSKTMNNEDNCIYLENITKIFSVCNKDVTGLNNLTINIPKNQVTAIVGPNGCGKSTVVQILSGDLIPDLGKIFINNQLITNPKELYNNIAIFQKPCVIFTFLTVSEYINFFVKVDSDDELFIDKMLDINTMINVLDISEYWDIQIFKLPKSVISLLEIICIFLMNRPIIILDEPYGALDFLTKQKINRLINIRKSKHSIIVLTNRTENIDDCADKIILMISGSAILQKNIREMLNSNKMGLKLVCTLLPYHSDFQLIKFIKTLAPDIIYDSTIKSTVHFTVPPLETININQILSLLKQSANKIHLSKTYLSKTDISTYIRQIVRKYYLKVLVSDTSHFEKSNIDLDGISKPRSILKIFFVQIMNSIIFRLLSLTKFPFKSTLIFILPLFVIIFFTVISAFVKPNDVKIILNMKGGYNFPIKIGFIGDEPPNQLRTFVKDNFYYNQDTVFYNISFDNFIKNLKISLTNYSNALYFDYRHNKTVIISNNEDDYVKLYYMIRLFCVNSLNTFNMTLNSFDFTFKTEYLLDYNYVLRIIYLSLVTVISTILHVFIHNKNSISRYILQLISLNNCVFVISKFVLAIHLMTIFLGYVILLFYLLKDIGLIEPDYDVFFLFILILVYILADLSWKHLLIQDSEYCLFKSFVVLSVDVIWLFVLIIYRFQDYVDDLKYHGLNYNRSHLMKFHFYQLSFIILPSSNLHVGFNLYRRNSEKNNEYLLSVLMKALRIENPVVIPILLLICQFIVYCTFNFIYENPYFSIRFLARRLTQTNIQVKVCEDSIFTFHKVQMYEGVTSLYKPLNFDLKIEKINLIVGPNKSHKSQLIEMILGTVRPSKGRIFYKEQLLVNIKWNKHRELVSYCPQMPISLGQLTVYELFIYWCKMRSISNSKINRLCIKILTDLDLGYHHNKLYQSMTDAMQRKLLVGLSILGFPYLIILDDPLYNLDFQSRTKVLNLMKIAKSKKCTLVINTTDLFNFHLITDHLVVINHKEIVYSGNWKDMPRNLPIGYFLTLVFNYELNEYEVEDNHTKEILSTKFTNVRLVCINSNVVTYFLEAEDKNNIDTTFIIVSIEELLKSKLDAKQYLINFNFFLPDD